MKIYVAGHRGMAGSAIVRQLQQRGDTDVLLRGHQELDLESQAATEAFFASEKPQQVYLAAARVGGINANNRYPADFIQSNLQIQLNVISAAHRHGVSRLLFLGSSCIYPRLAPQPMAEDSLMGGPLELTNEPYAVAKIAGIKLCESYRRQHGADFRSIMPTNLYGPGDNFHPENSHVLPALLWRFHRAARSGDASVSVWGSGRPKREFLHVDDMARACLHLMELPADQYWREGRERCSHINAGTGQDISIAELAQKIALVTGFEGAIEFDASMPDGTPRKLLDVSRLQSLGWQAGISLEDGLESTYRWMLDNETAIAAEAES